MKKFKTIEQTLVAASGQVSPHQDNKMAVLPRLATTNNRLSAPIPLFCFGDEEVERLSRLSPSERLIDILDQVIEIVNEDEDATPSMS
mmetsp:Transcript_13818/g.18035  ORF Transcript_13818/g.18035 Transcript_13818/m.18035 type:complete len:88 (+) Transcript_13818:235-498(+)